MFKQVIYIYIYINIVAFIFTKSLVNLIFLGELEGLEISNVQNLTFSLWILSVWNLICSNVDVNNSNDVIAGESSEAPILEHPCYQ